MCAGVFREALYANKIYRGVFIVVNVVSLSISHGIGYIGVYGDFINLKMCNPIYRCTHRVRLCVICL